MSSGDLQADVDVMEAELFLRTRRLERLVELRLLRDELREDLDGALDSVRWLRSELRVVKKAQPKRRILPFVSLACGLGALVGVGVAVWTP